MTGPAETESRNVRILDIYGNEMDNTYTTDISKYEDEVIGGTTIVGIINSKLVFCGGSNATEDGKKVPLLSVPFCFFP